MNAFSSLIKNIIFSCFIFFFSTSSLFVCAVEVIKPVLLSEELSDKHITMLECCDDLADDIYDTQTIIIACCKTTQSNFEFTFSLLVDLNNTLTTCCVQTQSNFEFTWSLIESICTGSDAFCCDEILSTLSRDFSITWSKIDACCVSSESNFEHTWSLIIDINNTLTTCCAQTQSNFEFTWSLIENLATGSVGFCCNEILSTLSRDFTITWSKIDACCVSSESNFEYTWSLIEDINNTLTTCCAQTQSNFEFTWSLIENLATGSVGFCCNEILNTLSRDFSITWSKIDACCLSTESNFEHTWSLIEDLNNTLTTCCAQTQSNFEITWSLIQHMCTGSGVIFCCDEILSTLSRDFTITWSKIDACCMNTESNFEHTWSLIEDLNNTLTTCCALTQSNFEFTWSLIENLATGSVGFCCNEILSTLSRDFTITWSKIDACCLSTESNFEHTWSLIEDLNNTLTTCCALTQSNFEFTWSLIEHMCTGSGVVFCCDEILNTLSRDFDHTFSLIEGLNTTLTTCCAQTQSNFEFTWSLIENLATGSVGFCCNEILNTLSRDFDHTFTLLEDLNNTLTTCCAQTQSNFEHTWSLIESICTGSGAFCCGEILNTLSRDFETTWSKIDGCCLITQSNFETTWSLITACCIQTQSNFEFTWSLIESICTGSGAFCCEEILNTLSRDFVTTWSKIDACCLMTQSNFEQTWSLINACCIQTQNNFEFTWSLIENICTGSGGGIGCCTEILDTLSSIRCSLGCFSDCAICTNNCELCSLTGSCVANCPNCPTFKNSSDGLSTVFCEIKAVEKLINDKFDELFEILSRIFCRTNCGC